VTKWLKTAAISPRLSGFKTDESQINNPTSANWKQYTSYTRRKSNYWCWFSIVLWSLHKKTALRQLLKPDPP